MRNAGEVYKESCAVLFRDNVVSAVIVLVLKGASFTSNVSAILSEHMKKVRPAAKIGSLEPGHLV